MKQAIDTDPEFVVFTANPDPDLVPLKVHEIERGSFPSMHEAEAFARKLFTTEGVPDVQISKRQWVHMTVPKRWYASHHARAELRADRMDQAK